MISGPSQADAGEVLFAWNVQMERSQLRGDWDVIRSRLQADAFGMDSRKSTNTDCRRSSPRMPQEMLRCNLGQVLELSAGGMRVLCDKLPPPEAVVEFPDYTLPGKLTGSVVWSKQGDGSMREIGIRFRGLTPKMALRLSEIGAFNRDRRIYNEDGSSTGRV